MDPLKELMMRYETAAYVLRRLEEQGATEAEFAAQLAYCRDLRRQMNQRCPDSETYDPRADNVVERFDWR